MAFNLPILTRSANELRTIARAAAKRNGRSEHGAHLEPSHVAWVSSVLQAILVAFQEEFEEVSEISIESAGSGWYLMFFRGPL